MKKRFSSYYYQKFVKNQERKEDRTKQKKRTYKSRSERADRRNNNYLHQ